MPALHQHPAEGAEEEEVEGHGHQGAEGGEVGGVQGGEEEEVGQEEGDAEVGVDTGPVTRGDYLVSLIRPKTSFKF